MIKEIDGDIFKQDVNVICHQTNCMGVMGVGIAKTIRDLYPEVFETYRSVTKMELGFRRQRLLGTIQPINTHDGKTIINMFSQYTYGRDRCYTQYPKFEECCYEITKYCKENNITKISMPYKIGCNNAGGDWEKVYSILELYFGEDSDILLILCKYNN